MYSKNKNPNFNSNHINNMQSFNFLDKKNRNKNQYPYSNFNKENFPFKKKNNEIKHSNAPENFKIKYIEYDDLENFQNSQDPQKIFQSIKEDFISKNWIKEFDAINNLRKVHKFYPTEINIIFEAFGDFIKNSLISEKTCILRNILAFIKEIIHDNNKNMINMNILIKLPSLIIRLENHTSFCIRKMAKIILSDFTKKCCCVEILNCFLELSVGKNKDNKLINNKCFFYVTEIIDFMGDGLCKLDTKSLKQIFFVLGIIFTESKIPGNRITAQKILNFFYCKMGEINFEKFLEIIVKENILKYSVCQEIIISLKNQKNKKSTRISVKDMICNDIDNGQIPNTRVNDYLQVYHPGDKKPQKLYFNN